MNSNTIILCSILTFVFLVPVAAQVQFTIADDVTGKPIEGAVAHFTDAERVYRANYDGVVTAPVFDGESSLRIFAKNYATRYITIASAELNQSTLALTIDSLKINPVEAKLEFTRADTLRGTYGPHRQNNDLLHYDLRMRLDIAEKYIIGSNAIRFRMLKEANRVQIDLFANMNVDSILHEGRKLSYERQYNAVFVDFPGTLSAESIHTIDFHYSGYPKETGRFGGIAFKEDSLGNPWIYTACQGIGASLWWPNKDQQRDEVDSMRMRIEIPDTLVDASNGRFMGSTDLGDGYKRFDWRINYPINNYCVSLNIGKYTHWRETSGELTLDYYVLPYHLEKAKRQFAQTKPMMDCFEDYLGPYPFPKDGFKLIEVPYTGMEHQSAVTYGNLFKNGYMGRDWTGVGVSDKFDFIIIHESGHEWFGNSVTCNDVSDAWIQEGWCTYTECLYVECVFGYEDAIRYTNGYAAKVKNEAPIIGPTGVNHWPTSDQYFKGALFMNTLRHALNADFLWREMLQDYAKKFAYSNIYTTDIINFMNPYLRHDLTYIFEQYLYYWNLPILQIHRSPTALHYRWQTDVPEFDMPVAIRTNAGQERLLPTNQWQQMPIPADSPTPTVATDLFYIEVEELESLD